MAHIAMEEEEKQHKLGRLSGTSAQGERPETEGLWRLSIAAMLTNQIEGPRQV
jgi:hypothetical protein